MSMSGINQSTAAASHGMNDRSVIVTLSPTRYLCFENTPVRHPKHPLDLIVLPLDHTRELLGVGPLEPHRWAEVRTASPPQRRIECFSEEDTPTLDPRPGTRAIAARGTCPGRCSTACGACRTCRPNIPAVDRWGWARRRPIKR